MLIVIVLVISLVFQQSHNAWNAGTRRANADTTLRGIMGFLERDLTHAIDDIPFGNIQGDGLPTSSWWSDILANSGETIFLTLDGTNRVPQVVSYRLNSGGELFRKTWQLKAPPPSSVDWVALYHSDEVPLCGTNRLATFVLSNVWSRAVGATNLPLRVDIQAQLVKKKNYALVSGRSAGRDRVEGTADDLIGNE